MFYSIIMTTSAVLRAGACCWNNRGACALRPSIKKTVNVHFKRCKTRQMFSAFPAQLWVIRRWTGSFSQRDRISETESNCCPSCWNTAAEKNTHIRATYLKILRTSRHQEEPLLSFQYHTSCSPKEAASPKSLPLKLCKTFCISS